MIWAALTALSFLAIGWVVVFLTNVLGEALGHLQGLLIPVAVAAVLAYLLDPLVEWINKKGWMSRTNAVLCVFAVVFLPLAAILLWVVPQIYRESLQFACQ